MKSKLFLSLSLLTAVFTGVSVEAKAVKVDNVVRNAVDSVTYLDILKNQASGFTKNATKTAKAAAKKMNLKNAKSFTAKTLSKAKHSPVALAAGLATYGTAVAGAGYYASQHLPTVETPVETGFFSREEQAVIESQIKADAKAQHLRLADIVDAKMAQAEPMTRYESFKAYVSNAYNNMTLENAKIALSNGYNATKTFVVANPGTTTAAVAATALVGYGAYKLYRGDFSSKAKQTPVAPKAQTPKPVNDLFAQKKSSYSGQV